MIFVGSRRWPMRTQLRFIGDVQYPSLSGQWPPHVSSLLVSLSLFLSLIRVWHFQRGHDALSVIASFARENEAMSTVEYWSVYLPLLLFATLSYFQVGHCKFKVAFVICPRSTFHALPDPVWCLVLRFSDISALGCSLMPLTFFFRSHWGNIYSRVLLFTRHVLI